MTPSQIYAVVAGSLFCILSVVQFVTRVVDLLRSPLRFFRRYVAYPYFIRRHRLLGPLSRGRFCVIIIVTAVNTFFGAFRVGSVADARLRTANMAAINLIPLFFGLHTAFAADILGIPVDLYHFLHALVSVMYTAHAVAHSAIGIETAPGSLFRDRAQIYGVTASIISASILLASLALCRRLSYEVFLRLHQILSVGLVYTLWRHVKQSHSRASAIYVYILAGLFCTTVVLEIISTIFRNFAIRSPYSRAIFTSRQDTVRVTLSIPRPWTVKPGQYINLWVPAVSFRSMFLVQTHPFMIVSWTKGTLMSLELVIQPQNGLTRRFREIADQESPTSPTNAYVAFYTGPHGQSASMGDYGTIVMFANGFGIIAQLPYIKQLLSDRIQYKARTQRIHLIWQLREPGEERSVNDLLDHAYERDACNGGYILQISLYYQKRHKERAPEFGGRHGRYVCYSGNANPLEILESETKGEYDVYVEGKMERRSGRPTGDFLVSVAADPSMRDAVREAAVRLGCAARLLEHEYQPVAPYTYRNWSRRLLHRE